MIFLMAGRYTAMSSMPTWYPCTSTAAQVKIERNKKSRVVGTLKVEEVFTDDGSGIRCSSRIASLLFNRMIALQEIKPCFAVCLVFDVCLGDVNGAIRMLNRQAVILIDGVKDSIRKTLVWAF